METVTVTMEALISLITTFFSTLFTDWVPELLTMVASQPILALFVVALPICGAVIGYTRRMFSVG